MEEDRSLGMGRVPPAAPSPATKGIVSSDPEQGILQLHLWQATTLFSGHCTQLHVQLVTQGLSSARGETQAY